jgi:hypothetical protein
VLGAERWRGSAERHAEGVPSGGDNDAGLALSRPGKEVHGRGCFQAVDTTPGPEC